jgi:CelD/BcsL family acetyltransferase involved in cellulose biosynthesis
MDQPEVFYTYEWALAMEIAYRSSLTPWVLLAYDNETLAGVAVLASNPSSHAVTFLSATTADYCTFVCMPQNQAEFIDGVFAELKKAKVEDIVLASVPDNLNIVAAIKAAATRYGYLSIVQAAARCARVSLASGDQRAVLKKNAMGKLRRKLTPWEKEGPVVLRHCRSWDESERQLPRFFNAHVARFLTTGRISNICSTQRRKFLVELGRLLSSAGWFTLSIVEFRDTLVSSLARVGFGTSRHSGVNMQNTHPDIASSPKSLPRHATVPGLGLLTWGSATRNTKDDSPTARGPQ